MMRNEHAKGWIQREGGKGRGAVGTSKWLEPPQCLRLVYIELDPMCCSPSTGRPMA